MLTLYTRLPRAMKLFLIGMTSVGIAVDLDSNSTGFNPTFTFGWLGVGLILCSVLILIHYLITEVEDNEK